MRYTLITILFLSFNLFSYNENKYIHIVLPSNETPQVITKGDAADDPAIWLNSLYPEKSLIFGTDKRSGIYIYDLGADIVSYNEIGNINNVDIRTVKIFDNYSKKHDSQTFIFGSNRTNNSLSVWFYNDVKINRALEKNNFRLSKNPHISKKANMVVYGVCAGIDREHGLIAFLTEDEGSRVQMWKYNGSNFEIIKTFNNQNAIQSEGCVYDDENRTLFISEEQDRGILRAYVLNKELNFLDPVVIDTRDGNIFGDPEGITIYKTTKNEGYLILSSQGDSTFNIYNRKYPYEYFGSFKISHNQKIDGVSDTDGIDALNYNLNKDYPEGLLVVQDGTNDGEINVENQNFKYISFTEIISALNL